MRWAILGLLLATWGAACTTFSSDPGDASADAGVAADGSSVPSPLADGGLASDAAVALPVTYDPAFRCAGRRLFDGLLVCNDFEAATEAAAFDGLSDKEANGGAVSLERQPSPPQGFARSAVPSVSGRAVLQAVVQRDVRDFRFGVDLRRGQGVLGSSTVIELGPVGAPFFVLRVDPTSLEVSLGGEPRVQGFDGEWHRFTVKFAGGALRASVDGVDFGLERRGDVPTSFEVRVGFPEKVRPAASEATLDIDNLVFKVD